MELKALNILTVRFAANGITAFIMNYDRNMARQGLCADFVMPNEPPERVAREIAARGGRVFVLPQRNRSPISYMRALSRIVREGGYDVVHAHGNSATLYVEMRAAARGGARIRIAHSHNTSCKQKLADRLLRPLFYKSYTHALACGQAAGEWLFPERPFAVVQNAVDTRAFAFDPQMRQGVRARLDLCAAPVVCHVGSFNVQKNHTFLLAAFAALAGRMPDARLLLVGDGPLLAEARAQAERLRLSGRVCFAGTVTSAAPYLCAADAFVLPSLYEGLPFTLVEAQCAGLPCLVSEAVTREAFLTPDVAARSVTGGDAAERWAAALEAALHARSDEAARARASAAAVKAAEKQGFSIEHNAEALLRLYRQFCARPEADA